MKPCDMFYSDLIMDLGAIRHGMKDLSILSTKQWLTCSSFIVLKLGSLISVL